MVVSGVGIRLLRRQRIGGHGLLKQELNHGGDRNSAHSSLAVKPLALGLGGSE
jgi:hypothetical protein